jgi:hypothetical protein
MPQPVQHRDRSLAWYLAALMGILAVPLLALTVIPTWMHLATERGRLEAIAGAAREDVLSLLDRDLAAKVAILRARHVARARRRRLRALRKPGP